MKINNIVTAKAYVYRAELEYISRCVLDYPDIETGGDLFGFWTHTGCPVIQYVIGPGKNANHQVAFFNQDLEYLDDYGKILRSGHALQHIGQWHSHHRLGLAEPSQHDITTVCSAINQYGLNQFFLVITNIHQQATSINGFLFKASQNREFNYTGWEILEGESPIRKSVDSIHDTMVSVPNTVMPSLGPLPKVMADSLSVMQINYNTNSWLKDNHIVLKKMMDGLSATFTNVKAYLSNDNNAIFLELKHSARPFKIHFISDFPEKKPEVDFYYKGRFKKLLTGDINWEPHLDIADRTICFMNSVAAMKIKKKNLMNIIPMK